MKTSLFLIILSITFFNVNAQVNPKNHYVKAHITKNGTYVSGYYATDRNYTNRDNYGTRPNINPYTGKAGTIEPDRNYNYSRTYNRTPYSSTPSYSEREIHTGSRGGRYYINKNGNKTYIK